MRFLVFFFVWFSVLGLAHWYVGRRIIRTARFTGRARTIAWLVVAAVLLTPSITFFLFINRAQGGLLDTASWVSYLILGFFTLVLTFIILRDVALLLTKGIDKLRGYLSPPPQKHVDTERRRFIIHASNIAILGASAAASGYGFYQAYRRAAIEEVDVPLPNLPEAFDGFKILQFSDLHVGPTIKRDYVERVVEQINGVNADMIAFTGDFVDGSVAWLKDDVAPVRELKAPFGKFFVTGNHEYYSGVREWVKEADRLGFDVLMNEHRVVMRNGEGIVMAGVTDYGAHEFTPDQASDPLWAVAASPDNLVRILLAHQPRSIAAATKAKIDLQLSGHTHGGQYFPGDYLARLAQPYIKGLHWHGNTQIYVNRGIGYWGPPIRIGAPPELTVITLRRA